MSNKEEEEPIEQPKRKRGRPRGSFAVRPNETQRAAISSTLDTLAALSPIENLIDGKPVASKRFTPAAFHAQREARFLEVFNSLPVVAPVDAPWIASQETFVAYFEQNPSRYSPQGIESWKRSEEAWAAVFAKLHTPEGQRQALLDEVAHYERLVTESESKDIRLLPSEDAREIHKDTIEKFKKDLKVAKDALAAHDEAHAAHVPPTQGGVPELP